MPLLCRIGMHSWRGCRCPKCGRLRNKQHDWKGDCRKCVGCGRMRNIQHTWVEEDYYALIVIRRCITCRKFELPVTQEELRRVAIEANRAKDRDWRKDKDWARIAEAAIGRITDQCWLAKLEGHEGERYRQEQIGFGDGWGTEPTRDNWATNEKLNEMKLRRLRALKGGAEDQAAIAQMALGSPYWRDRCAAAEKLADQAALAKVAEDRDPEVRRIAAGKLADQVPLESSPRTIPNWRFAALPPAGLRTRRLWRKSRCGGRIGCTGWNLSAG